MGRRILHIDFNGFFASVECFFHPEIRPFPVAVTGDPEKRHGIVLAKNQLAKKFGVSTGEAIWEAKQKCPNLVCVSPHYDQYVRFSNLGRELYHEYSDLIEPFGLDENWVDVTGRTRDFTEAIDLANEIRERVHSEIGITVSVGVADNKIFAKLGSDLKKPDAVSAVLPDNYREVAWRLPVGDLLMVGPSTKKRLNRYGIMTIGDLAETDPAFLQAQFGKAGLTLHRFANGEDNSPVLPYGYETPVKSVGNGITAPRDLVNNDDVRLTLLMLSESVSRRLREHGFRANVISLSVRDCGLFSFTRQKHLRAPSYLTDEILDAAMELFTRNYDWQRPIRSLTVCASELWPSDRPIQLNLFGEEEHRKRLETAERAIDGIRNRFGYHAVLRGRLLTDRTIGIMNPKEEHVSHPVGYRA